MPRKPSTTVGSAALKIEPPTAPVRAPFDLSTRYAAETVDLNLTDPAQLGKQVDIGVRITIRSVYSVEARDAVLRERSKLQIVNGKVDAAAASAQQDAVLFEQTVAIVTGWYDINADDAHKGELFVAGKYLPCTPENVRALFSDPRTNWMQKQVQIAYLDLERFFPKPKGNS